MNGRYSQFYGYETGEGGHVYTIVTSEGGKGFTLAASGAGVVTTFAGSVYTAATGSLPYVVFATVVGSCRF